MNQTRVDTGYIGWLGNNNLGDEAIYLAIDRESDDLNLKVSEYADDAQISLLGGGTILPLVFRNNSAYHFQNRDLNIALGTGVARPSFENQRRAQIDLRWLFAQANVDILAKIDRFGLPGAAIQTFSNNLPGVSMQGVYCDERDFLQADDSLDIITVRGPHSQRTLAEYGIKSEIVGDTALLLEPEEYQLDASNKIVVCLRNPGNGRKWSYDRKYIDEVLRFCRSVERNIEFVFLPFSPDDIPLHRDLANSLPNARWADYTSYVDIDGVLDELSSAELVIGEKLHASILSACCYTPFISLGYAPKNEDFCASLDLDEFNIRIRNVTESNLHELYSKTGNMDIDELRRPVNEYRERLRGTIQEVEEKIPAMPRSV